MRVLIIHCAYQFKGGEDTVVEEETSLLREAGVEVEVLRFSNEGRTLKKILQLPFNLASYRRARKTIASFQPDVVHIHNLHFAASPSVIYAVKHAGVPMVNTLHNYRLLCPSAILFHNGKPFLDSLNRSFPWKAVKEGVYKNSVALSFWMALSMQIHHWLGTWKVSNRYIVLSGHAKSIFQKSKLQLSSNQLTVKPNFCTVPALDRIDRGNDFLFVGRLSEEKGIPLLLSIFKDSAHRLTIAGDGPLKEEVLAATGKHSNIDYVGSLAKPALMKLMQQSSALVFPSVWYEGMPLTIIEAFACGLPVIATRLGAMEYMVTPGKDGLLFEAGNPQELQQQLDLWQSLSIEQKQIYSTNANATYQQHYTPEINARQLLNIYDEVTTKATTSSSVLSVTTS